MRSGDETSDNFLFAYDMYLIAEDDSNVDNMLTQLKDEFEQRRLQINMLKTKM